MDRKVACPCQSCHGLKMLDERTVQRHMDKDASTAKELPDAKRQRIAEESKESGLHPGTPMTAFMLCLRLIVIYHAFAGVTQHCIDEIIRLISDVLGTLVPAANLPRDFRSLKKLMNLDSVAPMNRYTVCPGECAIFKSTQHYCKKRSCLGKEGKPYFYLPLIPRLRNMFETNPELAKNIQLHGSCHAQPDTDLITDIQDSPAWRELYGPGGFFEGNPRGVALEYSADGFQPFHHTTSEPYSVEQQASVILNLPQDMRTKPGFVLLHGLIPGPKAPKDEASNLYMKPLVDELQILSTVGVPGVWDAHKKEFFTMKAFIFLHVHDFPGQAKAFKNVGCGGKHPCPRCKTEGLYSKQMGKMIFRGDREFLEADDPLRQDRQFPGGKPVRNSPNERNYEEETALAAVSGRLDDYVKTTTARSKERRNAKAAHSKVMGLGGRKRRSEFDRLGDREASKIAFEGMHTIQGVGKRLHGILNGHKDSIKVRQHEEAIGRFPGCVPDGRSSLPDAPFTLNKQEMKIADSRVATISIPTGKGHLPKTIFGSCYSMKSHTWHLILTKGVYPYVMRELIGNSQRIVLTMFCHIMAIACTKSINQGIVGRIGKHLHRCMALIDRQFPETLKTILWHMLHHLPEFLQRYGPIHSYWMYCFERNIHHNVTRLHNSKHPEVSMIHSYQIGALCASLGDMLDIASNRPNRDPGTELYYLETDGNNVWRGGKDTGSTIYKRDDTGALYLGRVLSFFKVDDVRYANIHWYQKATEDADTMLMTCPTNTRGDLYPAVPVSQLAPPLITAEEDGTLHALDFLDTVRTKELLDWMDRLPAQL